MPGAQDAVWGHAKVWRQDHNSLVRRQGGTGAVKDGTSRHGCRTEGGKLHFTRSSARVASAPVDGSFYNAWPGVCLVSRGLESSIWKLLENAMKLPLAPHLDQGHAHFCKRTFGQQIHALSSGVAQMSNFDCSAFEL